MSKSEVGPRGNEVFRALADPTRRRVLRLLNAGPMNAGDLARQFEISGPSMSHHFNVLRQADLIDMERNGQQLVYSLNTTVVQDLLGVLMELLGSKESAQEPPL